MVGGFTAELFDGRRVPPCEYISPVYYGAPVTLRLCYFRQSPSAAFRSPRNTRQRMNKHRLRGNLSGTLSGVVTLREYHAVVWPCRRGTWEDPPVVARCQALQFEQAIGALLAEPEVDTALVEENPRLAGGWFASDDMADHWAEDWPDRANVLVYGEEIDDDYPILVVRVNEDVVGWDENDKWVCLDCATGGGEPVICADTTGEALLEGTVWVREETQNTCALCDKPLVPEPSDT